MSLQSGRVGRDGGVSRVSRGGRGGGVGGVGRVGRDGGVGRDGRVGRVGEVVEVGACSPRIHEFRGIHHEGLTRIILDDGMCNWSFIPNTLINNIGKQVCLNLYHTKVKVLPLLNTFPDFYKEVIQAYTNTTNLSKPLNIVDRDTILGMPLWGNQNVIYVRFVHSAKKSLFFYNWIKSGVFNIGDLKFDNNSLDEQHIHNTISNKANIYAEIIMLKQC